MKYEGGCHCKKVRFEVELDISQPAIECNCSHCEAKGLLLQFVPADQFTLTQGEDELTEYRFNKETISHQFCSTCGVQSFAMGSGRDGAPTACINLRTIDGADLTAVTRQSFNGRDI